ncbi:F0F1 ATP synthase subunit epsilon [Suttonella sp. R2A3]|uniref:F0F1 ATP synthase subunit epsilon n=1 Tax=Suttonella sp. R2A3 TaxID=2908648 RepID=UPI001F36606C|nr:F0F1 ATP synthase subunit epsilon [Suttonella sp. R2A3]UJF23967.1 F0F1 ATP synthase subunit epsilon [Suttonella sp. R2A3]
MAKTFHVNVVSADRQLFNGEVSMIVATAVGGELGILPGHTPMLAALKPGQVRLYLDEDRKEDEVIYVSGGFIEVQPHETLILADEAKRAEQLDPERVEAARRQAEERMKDSSQNKIDHAKAQIELMQAAAQLAAIRRSKK